MPILVAHLVSLEATAYWYPAWMMAWVAYSTPVLVGLVQFAEGVKDPPAGPQHPLGPAAGRCWSAPASPW